MKIGFELGRHRVEFLADFSPLEKAVNYAVFVVVAMTIYSSYLSALVATLEHPNDRVARSFRDCSVWCAEVIYDLYGAKMTANKEAAEALLGCTKDPCIIYRNNGGSTLVFGMVALAATLHPTRSFVIDGPCLSACTIIADYARDRVCITPRAVFGFHQEMRAKPMLKLDGTTGHTTEYRDPTTSQDIAAWVYSHGGYPQEGMTFMYLHDAADIWRVCNYHPPLPPQRPHATIARR